MNFVSLVANRYLFTRKSENFINLISIFSVLSVAVGITALNVAMAIMSGFETELKNQLIGSVHIHLSSPQEEIRSWPRLEGDLLAISEVATVSPYLQGQVLLRTPNNQTQGVILKGIAADSAERLAIESASAPAYQQGIADLFADLPALTGKEVKPGARLPQILLGLNLTQKLGIFGTDQIAGSKLTMISPELQASPLGLAPRQVTAQIAGIYQNKVAAYEGALAYTTLAAAKRFFRQDFYSGVELTLHDPNQSAAVKGEISTLLNENYQELFYISDWTEQNKALWEAIALEKKAYFIVLLLIIVLASFSIITSLIMIVLEKRKDIAIMRTFGAPNQVIRRIFFRMGSQIGLYGATLGLVLSFVTCFILSKYGFDLPKNIFPTDTLPVEVNIFNFFTVAVLSWLICLLATIYPAYRASKTNVCEVLRSE